MIEANHRRILDHSPNILFVNHEDRVAYINPAGARLLGAATCEEMLGRSIYDLFVSRVHDKIRHRIDRLRVAPGVAVEPAEETMRTLDGQELAAAIAAEMGLDAFLQQGLRLAGNVHDVGKIQIPAEILAKPTRLTEIEFSLVKEHAQHGYDVLKGIAFPWPVAEVVLQHHERIDGSGYPQGLKNEQIILEARIIAVADVVESMSGHRPYRPALGIDTALKEIEKGAGKGYDPQVATACLRLFRELDYEMTE